MRYVAGTGNPSAKLMIIGEAPSASDEENGIPFTGPSGDIVTECLRRAGVDRGEVYLTNVCKVRPPNGEIRRIEELGVKLEHFIPQMWQEVEAINPNCILAIGNTALKALTGETGINNFRGSILPNRNSGIPKVVGSIHPASLFHAQDGKMRSYRDKAFIQFDFERAVAQSLFREYRKPDRLLHIAHNSLDLIRFLERNIARGFRRIVYDIETFKAIPMCISFAFSRFEAISVPLFDLESKTRPDGIPLHDMEIIWRTIADILMDVQFFLIGHNLKFDQGRLEDIGLPTTWPYFDTQLGFQAMFPELPKKLAFVTSVLTEEPYYKDDLEEYNPKKQALEKRLIYNARDSAVTFEVFEEEYKHLEETNMLDYFFNVQMPKHKFYYKMERRGIRQDMTCRKWLRSKYERYSRWLHTAVTRDVGHEVNVNSNGMGGQVARALFLELKCPVRKDTTSDTLKMLMLNAVKDEKRQRIIKNMLQERKVRKTVSTYLKCKLAVNDRAYTTFNITGTETDRTSTSKPKPPVVAEPQGIAFQTLTKHGDMAGDEAPVGIDLRRSFIPDEGMCFIEPDLSQSQARMVAWMANDFKALDYMNRKDFVKNKFGIKDDLHTWTTQLVTGASFEIITEDMRQLGKKTRHAGNFGMGKRRLSFMAQISEWKAGQCLEKFHAASPMIQAVYWKEIIQALQDNDGVLVSPMGAQRKFFDRWGEELFKQAYAHLPQIIESEHVKAAAIRISERCPWMDFLGEFHDSFLAQIPIHKLHEAYQIIKEELEKPIDFRRCSISRGLLVIPCDMKVGYQNWEKMVGYKAA